MTIEFTDPEGFIIGECADKRMKRMDVAKTYALLLKHEGRRDFDWNKVNEAIASRWSLSGLYYIKKAAWSGKCWNHPQEPI